jgi:hypothetical protein
LAFLLKWRGTNKLAIATAKGVLCSINRIGMTGARLHLASTSTNKARKMTLAMSIPHTSGLDHGISSEVLRLRLSKRNPTLKTSIKDPVQSTILSFSYVDRDCISAERGILTFKDTIPIARLSAGTCETWSYYSGYCSQFQISHLEKKCPTPEY